MDSLTSKHPRSGFTESDDNDAELVAVLNARREDDKDDADDSKAVVPWALLQAPTGSGEMKIFVQANQQEHPELRKYNDAVEGLGALIEKMPFSARSKQITLLDHAFERRPGPQ